MDMCQKWRIYFILFVDETENSDTDGAIYSEDDGVSRKDNGRKISDNDDDDNERDDDNDDDDDGKMASGCSRNECMPDLNYSK